MKECSEGAAERGSQLFVHPAKSVIVFLGCSGCLNEVFCLQLRSHGSNVLITFQERDF